VTRFVAFLRGINVGGKNKIAMGDLRSVCTEQGLENVETYIQSGNVAFSTRSRSASNVESAFEKALKASTGLDITVVARRSTELARTVADNPFVRESPKPTHLVVVFLKSTPRQTSIDLSTYGPEVAVRKGRDLYIHYVNGQGRSKVTNAVLERLLGVPGTARNWNTVTKMVALADGS
jgi:uncharacterized protein (DUF1697 family)